MTSEADCVKSYDHLLGPGAGGTQAEEADTRTHAGDSTSGSGVHHSEVSNMGLSWVSNTGLLLVEIMADFVICIFRLRMFLRLTCWSPRSVQAS